jgi:tetratricopeptide (TPR) repeat protein
MKKFFLLFFFISFSSLFTCIAQDRRHLDSLQKSLKQFEAHKKEMGSGATPLTDTEKANLLYGIVLEYWTNASDTGIYYAQQVLSVSEQAGYEKGVSNAYNGLGLIYMQMKKYSLALEYYQKALKIRTAIGYKKGMAGTYNNLGLLYGNQNKYNEAIQWELKAIEINKEIGDRESMSAAYGKMARIYASLGKYTEALKSLLNSLKIGEETGNKSIIGGAYLEIGNIYYELGNYPEALKNYEGSLRIENKIGEKYRVAYAYGGVGRICYKLGNDTGAIRNLLVCLKMQQEEKNGERGVAFSNYNLALIYIDMGNYPVALNYCLLALREYREIGFNSSQAMTLIEIGTIYEKMGKLQSALDSTAKGLSFAKQINAMGQMKDAYYRLADINTQLRNYKEANEDYKEYNRYLDSVSSNLVQQKISMLQINYAFEKKEDSIRLEQTRKDIIKITENRRKSLITGSAVVIALLTLLIAILVIKGQQIKHEKDRIIFEKETALLQLEKQRMEDELANAKRALDNYIKDVVKKNELLERLWDDFENMKSRKAKEIEIDENRIERLGHLNKTTILTEDDWNKFKELFEQVHKGFFTRLKEKLPDLTQAETRLLCLTKLNLDTKQMGGMLGVSFNTIKQSRYRLRKKLSLSEDDTLDKVVETI